MINDQERLSLQLQFERSELQIRIDDITSGQHLPFYGLESAQELEKEAADAAFLIAHLTKIIDEIAAESSRI